MVVYHVYHVDFETFHPVLSSISGHIFFSSLALATWITTGFCFSFACTHYTLPVQQIQQLCEQSKRKLLNIFWLNYFCADVFFCDEEEGVGWFSQAGNSFFFNSKHYAHSNIRMRIYPLRNAKPIDWLLPIQTSCHS